MANWSNEVNPFGPNRTPLLVGLNKNDGSTPIPVAVDPSNGQLQVNTGGGGGGGGTSYTDEAGFTAGSSTFTPAGGVFNDSATALTSGQQGTVRMTANRALVVSGGVPSGNTDADYPVKIGGVYNSTNPTLTNGQRGDVQMDSSSNLKVVLWTGTSNVATNADNIDGQAVSGSTIKLATMGRNQIFNGTSWDRLRSAGGANNTTGTGVLASAAMGQYNASTPTVSSGNYNALQIDSTANLKVNNIMAPTDSSPTYSNRSLGGLQLRTDSAGNLQTFSEIVTDQGTKRVWFTGTSLSYSPGSATFTNGSSIVTGSGFSTTDLHYLDYIKLSSDGESSWAQISYVDSDTQVELINPYSGSSTTGAYSIARAATVTGSGGSFSVASGQVTIASGTTSSSNTVLYSAAAFPPLQNIMTQSNFSVSQRIANQDIYFGLEYANASPRMFARFHFTGTTNTQVITESAYNPTTTPSSSEIESNTITLPSSGVTSGSHTYRIDAQQDQILFSIDGTVVATHTQRILPVWLQMIYSQIRILNGTSPASTTSVVANYMFHRAYARIDNYPISSAIVGQQTMSRSQPMVIASDQTNIPVILNAISGFPLTTALTTTQTVSGAAGRFTGFSLMNLNSAPAYLQVFDTTSAVTLGTTVPNYIFPIPNNSTAANGIGALVELTKGLVISNGIKVAATTTATGATTVSTGLAGTIFYQ